jgi:hypothetical protein
VPEVLGLQLVLPVPGAYNELEIKPYKISMVPIAIVSVRRMRVSHSHLSTH